MTKYDILHKYFGYTSFRRGQEALIDALLDGRDVLGVMPTGAGKSLCYQVPALMLSGVTLVVSPLVSLMKDQVNTLVQQGVRAAYLNRSLNEAQIRRAIQNAENGQYKIIYVAPERLTSAAFLNMCRVVKISLVAVDEAHCVSQWGQDFRPSYLNISGFIANLPYRPVLAAFTATATSEVKKDITDLLKLNEPVAVTTGFDRPNLFFSVIEPKDKSLELYKLLKERKGKSGIVYCSTRKKVEEICDFLNEKGFAATRYHAGLEADERAENQDDFVFDRKPVMVATNAFGMGIDKSNVNFVIHYNMPKNLESYYQEAGRAGRDGSKADCILLYGKKDVVTCRYFIDNAEDNPQMTEEQRQAFKQHEKERLRRMIYYCTTYECLRGYMLSYFGEKADERCDNCSNCLTEFEIVDATVEAQKILSCIIRTGQKHNARIISEVLRGVTNDKIKRLGLDKQSTFGIMKDSRSSNITHIIDQLERQECVITTGGRSSAICVTELSYPILKGNAKFSMKKTRAVKKREDDLPKDIQELLDWLKVVRTYHAKKNGVPAFVIFSDKTLIEMCRIKPLNDEEFLSVPGVGNHKLTLYGDSFMKIIRKYVEENGK